MTPTRPYFLRAVFDWLLDNSCTPFLAVNADFPEVYVPLEHVEDGQITLNISPSAVANFHMDNDYVSFSAKFSGTSRDISIPLGAMLGLYARENGQGMAFPDEELYLQQLEENSVALEAKSTGLSAVESDADEDKGVADDDGGLDKPKGRPSLTVVK